MTDDERDDAADNQHVLDALQAKRPTDLLRKLGVLPPEPTGSFDGGAREIAPPTTSEAIEADANAAIFAAIQRERQRRLGQ